MLVLERLGCFSLEKKELYKNKLAKFIRIVSIPPIVISILTVSLYYLEVINNFKEAVVIFIFLGFIPILAYPISYLKPFKVGGRKMQRKIAFILSLISYSLGIIYVFVFKSSDNMKIILFSYFFSIITLIIFNGILKIRASGHISSITGALVSLLYFLGIKAFLPIVLIYGLIFWASYHLKSHTKKEMIIASFIVIVSFITSIIIL